MGTLGVLRPAEKSLGTLHTELALANAMLKVHANVLGVVFFLGSAKYLLLSILGRIKLSDKCLVVSIFRGVSQHQQIGSANFQGCFSPLGWHSKKNH